MPPARLFSLLAFAFVALFCALKMASAQNGVSPIALGAYYYDNGLCAPGDEGAISGWRAKTGRLPAVWSIYQSWTGWNQFPANQARRAQGMGTTLMVTWEPWSGAARDSNWSCAAVVAGTYDAYIRQYARAVANCGAPVLLRLGHEMNGDWYPWGTAYTSNLERNNGNAPRDFVAMWRHVTQIFRVEGARNAQWVWSPNVLYINGFNAPARQIADLRALYPGDDAVDWIGLSVYNDGAHRPWRSFSQLIDVPYQVLTQITNRPLMIAELGVTEQGAPRGASKAQWLEQTLLQEIPARYPRVRLVNYFFRDKTGEGESNYRFDSSPDALSAFRAIISSPLYRGRLNPVSRAGQWDSPDDIWAAQTKVSVVSAAQVRAPTTSARNTGVFRNGQYSVNAPRLRAGQ